jgi:superfamily II DNA helicase RecQ
MNEKTDILAILSIDEGKSLLFFLPALMKTRLMMMMIVPLIAVMQDLRYRCVKTGISCAMWDLYNRSDKRCDLFFVAMKQAIELVFLNHLQIMHEMGILKRIVMDEAHVSLTHRDFRLDMEKLVIVMRTVPNYRISQNNSIHYRIEECDVFLRNLIVDWSIYFIMKKMLTYSCVRTHVFSCV